MQLGVGAVSIATNNSGTRNCTSSECATKMDNVQIRAQSKSAMECRRRPLRVRPVTELGWESTDQFAAADPAAYVLPQQFGDRRDGGRAGACFLDGNGPGDRQIVDW